MIHQARQHYIELHYVFPHNKNPFKPHHVSNIILNKNIYALFF